jgi:hypothetical protein
LILIHACNSVHKVFQNIPCLFVQTLEIQILSLQDKLKQSLWSFYHIIFTTFWLWIVIAFKKSWQNTWLDISNFLCAVLLSYHFAQSTETFANDRVKMIFDVAVGSE